MTEQQAFGFAPPTIADAKLRARLEEAVRAIAAGLAIKIGDYKHPVIIYHKRVHLDVQRWNDLLVVADYMGEADAIVKALKRCASEADRAAERLAKRKIGEVGEPDWRPVESMPEDLYAF